MMRGGRDEEMEGEEEAAGMPEIKLLLVGMSDVGTLS